VLIVGAAAVGLAVKALVEFSQEKLVVEMHQNVVLAPVFGLTDRLMPYLITIGIFTFLYKFMPNTFVKLRSAIVGGVAGGFLWATTGTIFTSFIVGSSNRQAIYASLAVAISALIWLYLNWIILLVGSQIAFYFQNPAYLQIGRRDPRLSNEMRERVALNIMYLVGKEHRNPVAGVDLRSISRTLHIPSITLAPIALGLETKGLLTTNEKEALLPGKEMSRIRLRDILSVVRQDGETGSHETPHWNDAINEIGKSIHSAVDKTLGDRTLSDLLDETESP
jgi:membrane protein